MKKRFDNFLFLLKHFMSNKGQFTVFVILGFVMFIVVVIMLMLVSAVSTQKLETETRSAVQEYIDASSINYYVYTCLDSVVNEAILDYAGSGSFFEADGESLVLSDEDEGFLFLPLRVSVSEDDRAVIRTVNVSYGVTSTGLCDLVDLVPPMYPKNFTRLSSLFNMYNSQARCVLNRNNNWDVSGFFGLNNLTKLCYLGSSNSLKMTPSFTAFSNCSNREQSEL